MDEKGVGWGLVWGGGRHGCQSDGLDELDTMGGMRRREGGREGRRAVPGPRGPCWQSWRGDRS